MKKLLISVIGLIVLGLVVSLSYAKTVVTVLEGEVQFSNNKGSVLAKAGEEIEVFPGLTPREPIKFDLHKANLWAMDVGEHKEKERKDSDEKNTSSEEKLYLNKIKEYEKLAEEALRMGNEGFASHYRKKVEEYERLLRKGKDTKPKLVSELEAKKGAEEDAPAHKGLPESVRGFSGQVRGVVVVKGDKNIFSFKVGRVLRVWEDNKAKNPKALIGCTVRIGPRWEKSKSGKWHPVERHVAFIRKLKVGQEMTLEIKNVERDEFVILELFQEQREEEEGIEDKDTDEKRKPSEKERYLHKIRELDRLAKEALERGDRDKARRYLEEAEKYERILRQQKKGTDKDTDEERKPSEKERYLNKIKELNRLAKEALKRGDRAKAHYYLKEAEKYEKMLR